LHMNVSKSIDFHKTQVLLKRFFIWIVFLAVVIFISLGNFKYVYAAEKTKPVLIYFYFSACEQCREAEKAFDEMNVIFKSQNKSLPDVRMYNVEEKDSYQLLDMYFHEYGVTKENQLMPVVFTGTRYFCGEKQVIDGLRNLAAKGDFGNTPLLKVNNRDKTAAENNFSSIRIFNVFFVGLANGFNPCSLSMLLFLLSLLLARKVNVVKMGLSFAAGKFIMYLLLGTLLFSLMSKLQGGWYNTVVKTSLIIFMFAIALLNVHDFFAAKKEKYGAIKNQLPRGLRKFNHDKIKQFLEIGNNNVLIIFCFLLGAAISVGEFLCTGQMYLATIALVVQSDSVLNFRAFLYLLIYDTAFILPLVAGILLIGRGHDIFRISEALRARLPLIKAVSAGLFFLFGVILLIFFNK